LACSQYLADLGRNRYYVIKFALVEVLSLTLAFAQERTNYSEIVCLSIKNIEKIVLQMSCLVS
jgi:hypothetical protein